MSVCEALRMDRQNVFSRNQVLEPESTQSVSFRLGNDAFTLSDCDLSVRDRGTRWIEDTSAQKVNRGRRDIMSRRGRISVLPVRDRGMGEKKDGSDNE